MPQTPVASDTIGLSWPLGATIYPGGANFSVYSRHATGMELLLFDDVDRVKPARVIPFDESNRSYHYWHAYVPGLKAGQLYGYRAHGPNDAESGYRFDPSRVLLDPYARGVATPKKYSRVQLAQRGSDSVAMKSVLIKTSGYDWEGDRVLRLPASRMIVYEMHVRGFTRNPNSGVAEGRRGTFAGLIEKIPYLQQLGITAVELMPVFQFDEQDAPEGLTNYWGYSPVSFFAPHVNYSSERDPASAVREFREMVKALHQAGIEVILDVVFNHTAEGNHEGPTLSLRGIDNTTYYHLSEDRARYANYTGTGNTLNSNHAVVRRMIVDSLRYWVQEMHVDGFRFDLASVLSRDTSGNLMPTPPVLWDIESDPALAGTKLIAEAWDAAGLYQVGSFGGDSWREWNGRFRDDVRSFFRGDRDTVSVVADRLLGSPQIYVREQREAEQSVNFVTCHDGFTLNDLVSYNSKHNEANREGNHDGSDDNRSCNWGVEGPADDPRIEAIRVRQMKNFLTVTMLSLGIPMILMGDEVRRTQFGNNNAYCQDNEISWFDWGQVAKNADLHRFVSLLATQRQKRDLGPERRHLTLTALLRLSNRSWHGVKINQPDWSSDSHSIALSTSNEDGSAHFYAILNAYWEPLTFELPPCGPDARWSRWIDTSLASPEDIVPLQSAPPIEGAVYKAEAHSVVMLISRAK
jgi:glycogen operon protein